MKYSKIEKAGYCDVAKDSILNPSLLLECVWRWKPKNACKERVIYLNSIPDPVTCSSDGLGIPPILIICEWVVDLVELSHNRPVLDTRREFKGLVLRHNKAIQILEGMSIA